MATIPKRISTRSSRRRGVQQLTGADIDRVAPVSDPGVRVDPAAFGGEGARALQGVGREVSVIGADLRAKEEAKQARMDAAALRISNRQDQLEGDRVVKEYRNALETQFRTDQEKSDFAIQQNIDMFGIDVDDLHGKFTAGANIESPVERLNFEAKMEAERAKIRDMASDKMLKLQKTRQAENILEDRRALVDQVAQNPELLSQSIQGIVDSVESRAGSLSESEEDTFMTGGMSDIHKAALDTLMLKGDVLATVELLDDPLTRAALDRAEPGMSQKFRERILNLQKGLDIDDPVTRARANVEEKIEETRLTRNAIKANLLDPAKSDLIDESGLIKNEVSNSILKGVVTRISGNAKVDPLTGEITGLTPEQSRQAIEFAAEAEGLIASRDGSASGVLDAVDMVMTGFQAEDPRTFTDAANDIIQSNEQVMTNQEINRNAGAFDKIDITDATGPESAIIDFWNNTIPDIFPGAVNPDVVQARQKFKVLAHEWVIASRRSSRLPVFEQKRLESIFGGPSVFTSPAAAQQSILQMDATLTEDINVKKGALSIDSLPIDEKQEILKDIAVMSRFQQKLRQFDLTPGTQGTVEMGSVGDVSKASDQDFNKFMSFQTEDSLSTLPDDVFDAIEQRLGLGNPEESKKKLQNQEGETTLKFQTKPAVDTPTEQEFREGEDDRLEIDKIGTGATGSFADPNIGDRPAEGKTESAEAFDRELRKEFARADAEELFDNQLGSDLSIKAQVEEFVKSPKAPRETSEQAVSRLKKNIKTFNDPVIPFLVKSEGFIAKARDIGDGKITVGFGITGGKKGETINQLEGMLRLNERLDKIERPFIKKEVLDKIDFNLNKNQIAAITSLVFNVGRGAFKKSKALKALLNGDLETFKKEAFDPKIGFLTKNPKFIKGLRNRRRAELKLFNKKVK